MRDQFRTPITLEGRFVRLVPLARDQLEDLTRAGGDPEIWQYILTGPADSATSMASLIDLLLQLQAAGTDLPFAILLQSTNRAVGMTRYLSIDRPNRTVEVGGSWLDRQLWQSPINTDAKRAMLSHAFDDEDVIRVQLKTDVLNRRSQRAIERLGAVREGVLRNHLIRTDGGVRSSVMYSILRTEWPEVRNRLDALLDRPWTGNGPVAHDSSIR